MPQLQLQLDAQLLSQMRTAAGREGTTINAVVRELLSGWLQTRQQPLALALREPERAAWPQLRPQRSRGIAELLRAVP